MKRACLTIAFAVLASVTLSAYENDGPNYNPSTLKNARLPSVSEYGLVDDCITLMRNDGANTGGVNVSMNESGGKESTKASKGDSPIDPRLKTRRLLASSFSGGIGAPEASDILFVTDSNTADRGDLGKYLGKGTITIPLKIERYFGDKDKLIKSGAIPKWAAVEFVTYDVDQDDPYDPEVDYMYFNGHKIGQLRGSNGNYHRMLFPVDMKYVNLPSSPGNVAKNTITVQVDVNNGGWLTSIEWISIYIPAAPPVILSHGINSNGGALSKIQKEIRKFGIPAETFEQENGGSDTIFQIGNLTDAIQSWKENWHVDHVNIVGHSMGGLRARRYAEDNNDVFKVLQIGSPNGGSPLADYLIIARDHELSEMTMRGKWYSEQEIEAWRQANRKAWEKKVVWLSGKSKLVGVDLNVWRDRALEDLQTTAMASYNQRHKLKSGVEYRVVAGQVTWLRDDYLLDADLGFHFTCETLNTLLGGIDPRLDYSNVPTDMIVPVWSAHTLVSPAAGSPLQGRSGIAWHCGLTDGGADDVVEILKPYLTEQKTTLSARTASGTSKSVSKNSRLSVSKTSSSSASSCFMQSGFVTKSDVVDVDFYIVSGDKAGVLLSFGGEGVCVDSFTLKDPSGITYTGGEDGVSIANMDGCVAVTLANPEVGTWSVSFNLRGGPAAWSLSVNELDTSVDFTPSFAANAVHVGDPLVVRVTPKVAGVAATCTCAATVRCPNGSYVTVPFTSSGVGGYTASIPTSESGRYQTLVRVSDNARPGLMRVVSLTGMATSSSSTFGGTMSATVADSDSNGLYDNLTVNFSVNATKAGTYRVLATLADTDGNEITEGWTSNIVCSAGTRTFPVAFDGRAIYGNGECEGYKVSSAKLLEIGEDYEAVVDERSDLFTTTAYTYQQFEHDLVAMKSGGSDSAVDSNGDGIYDRLDVTVPLYADDLVSGYYSWSASLMDADGILLGIASGNVDFVSGKGGASIFMSFGSDGIVATHKDGKYFIKNLILWNSGRNFTVSGEYLTGQYKIEDFGGELATVDLGFIVPSGWTDSLVVTTNATGTTGQTFFEQGDPIYLNYTFANIANQTAVSNFVNRFTLSNGSDYSDSWIGYGLREGGWGWLGKGVAPEMLQNLPAGTYTLTCELDVDGQLPETDEFNNVVDVTFTINESLRPNLKVSSASVSKTSLVLSDSAVFHWRVENTGRAAAKKTKTAFQTWKYDVSSDTWTLKKTENLDCAPLAAGGGREFTRTISGKTFGVGEFAIGVRADGNGSLMELDESDNLSFIYFTVSKDNATRSTSGVDWQFHKMKGEPDSFYLSTSAKAKKKATTFKVGQTIYMRCCWWNATKKAASGNMRVSLLLNGRQEGYTDRSNFNKSSWYYLTDRTPSFLQNLPAGKYTLTAVLDSENNFVEKNEKNNVRQISFTVVGAPTIYGEESFTCALNESVSWPVSSEGSMTVKGLPPGMKYSGGAIVGKATKLGTYSAKFTAKNAAGTRTKTIKIVVVNPGFDVSVNVRANGATDAVSVSAGETVPMFVGVVQNISVASTPGKDGIAKSGASSVTATGLPPGLKYSKGVISGVPSKVGTYTVKLTFKNALGWTKTFTMKMQVKALPAFARGTFNGWSYDADYYYKRKVTVSVTTAGKITAKVGTLSFARTGWTVDEAGRYCANLLTTRTVGTGKKAKKYTDVLTLTLDPDAPWTEDQLSGKVATFNGTVKLADALVALNGGESALVPSNADLYVSARRNPFGDNADAKALAAELVALGTQTLTDDDGLVWNLKVASNGVATIARTTGAGKNKKTVSATAVVAWDGDEYGPYAVFLVDGKIVGVRW